MTIKRKFLLCGLLVFVALGAIGVATGRAVRSAQHDQVRQGLETTANLEANRVRDLLQADASRLTHHAEVIGLVERVTQGDRAAIDAALAALSDLDPRVLATTVVDPNGTTIGKATSASVATVAPIDAAEIATMLDSIEVGAPFSIGSAFRVTEDDERYTQAVELGGAGGDPQAYLIVELDLQAIQDLFGQPAELGRTAEVHLVQTVEGGAQFITDPRFRPELRFGAPIPRDREDAPAILAAYGPAATYEDVQDYRDTDVVASVRPVSDTPWSLVAKIDSAEAFSTFDRAMRLGLVGFSAAAVFSVGALALAAQSVLRRIRRVAESAAAISSGELTARVGDLSHDELGTLARSFDSMADTLVADMARRREIEAELAHRARHDALTALPNRAAFQQELKSSLARSTRSGSIAVLFCDLDEFKTVNDDLGHTAGDALLREVSARLQRAVTDRHMLARFGGDEFVVVARDLHEVGEAVELAERMCEELSAPITLGGREVFVTTSVGVAMSHIGSTAETLVRDADAAMYQAKGMGRARVVVHDAGIGARTNNRLAMTTELHRAIANGGLTVALQPIADLATNEVHAMEVLVRWVHEGREIDPSEFVMRATELDLAGALDRWVLAESCRLMSTLRGLASAEVGWLHVNVTGTSLVDEHFASDVLAELAANRVSPSELCFEIVEDRLGGAPQAALATLDRLRQAGVRVAIDDFGTGHSSLARLRDLPADTVKIDQSFLRDLSGDPAALAITGSIISLADRLGLEVVAEGVETPDQARTLLNLGCRYGQGYLIGPPRRAALVVEDRIILAEPPEPTTVPVAQ